MNQHKAGTLTKEELENHCKKCISEKEKAQKLHLDWAKKKQWTQSEKALALALYQDVTCYALLHRIRLATRRGISS